LQKQSSKETDDSLGVQMGKDRIASTSGSRPSKEVVKKKEHIERPLK
jgi:hypothetical protein